jgi:hypothetical protein
MPLSDDDRSEIAAVIKQELSNGCLCGGHAPDVIYLMGRMKVIGNGNIEKGIESVSKTLNTLNKVRRIGEKVGGAVAVAVAVTISMGMLGLIWASVKAAIVQLRPGP